MKRNLAIAALTCLWLVAPGHKAQAADADYMKSWIGCLKTTMDSEATEAIAGRRSAAQWKATAERMFFICRHDEQAIYDSARLQFGAAGTIAFMAIVEDGKANVRLGFRGVK